MALSLIKRHESCRLEAYQDIKGIWTIGWGHTGGNVCQGLVWTQQQCDVQLANDMAIAEHDARYAIGDFPWLSLSDIRQAPLIDVSYNLGLPKFRKFHKMISAVCAEDWQQAHDQLLNSEAGKQLKERYTEDAEILLTGIAPSWFS
ncbi:MAG: lysozyme [Patescibacteria group bacterium]|nr:lysozyme [Patescibacteria group bacterium]